MTDTKRRITRYEVARGIDIPHLINQVEELLNEGFELYGELLARPDLYLQVMVKYKDNHSSRPWTSIQESFPEKDMTIEYCGHGYKKTKGIVDFTFRDGFQVASRGYLQLLDKNDKKDWKWRYIDE